MRPPTRQEVYNSPFGSVGFLGQYGQQMPGTRTCISSGQSRGGQDARWQWRVPLLQAQTVQSSCWNVLPDWCRPSFRRQLPLGGSISRREPENKYYVVVVLAIKLVVKTYKKEKELKENFRKLIKKITKSGRNTRRKGKIEKN